MSKINYPTLDLFIYNRTPESAQQKYENYWNDLDSNHQTEQIESSSYYKIFCQTEEKDEQIDIYYLRKSIQDTYLLYYNCSQDKEYELSQLTHVITKLKNLAVLPQIEKLDPGKLSQNGYLGKTWMISIWTNDSNEFTQDVAANLYHCLINRKHQHQQLSGCQSAGICQTL